MEFFKKNLPWIVRILISILFIVSGVAKMFPIWAFEKQLVDLGLTNWCVAHYLSRAIIGLEIAIGAAILQPHYLKKIVIPVTSFLLVAFCIHLSTEMYKHGAMNGNCGCFGQLIPMTPFEAFIKNVITLVLLGYLYKKVSFNETTPNRFSNLLLIYALSALLMFAAFPFSPCEDDKKTTETPQISMDTTAIEAAAPIVTKDTIKKIEDKKAKVDTAQIAKPEPEPTKVVSKFAAFNTFSGKKVNIDKGKKILCFFVPGCEHCQDAAKELVQLSKKPGFPEVNIIFMDEEAEKIPDFFKKSNSNFSYTILGVVEFWKLMGNGANTPGVIYLWNGNVIKFYEGTEGNKFDPKDLTKLLESKKF